MTLLFKNNASSTLATAINNTDDPVVLQVQPGEGAVFPAPTGGDTFLVSLEDDTGAIEVMLATDRTSDSITATRAQEGTTARAFGIGSRVECRVTAGLLDLFVQEGAPIDMGGNQLTGAAVDATSSWNGGTMQAGVYRSTAGSSNNAITIPDNDTLNPHVDGDPIVLQSELGGTEARVIYDMVYPVGVVIFMNELTNPETGAPAGVQWRQLTEGYNKFPKMSGTPKTEDPTGTPTTGAGGAHSHGQFDETNAHVLTDQEMPVHAHGTGVSGFYVASATGGGWPTGSPAEVGVVAFPQQTQFAGGGQGHAHGIEQGGDHTHPIDVQPPSYTLVPWLRIA